MLRISAVVERPDHGAKAVVKKDKYMCSQKGYSPIWLELIPLKCYVVANSWGDLKTKLRNLDIILEEETPVSHLIFTTV